MKVSDVIDADALDPWPRSCVPRYRSRCTWSWRSRRRSAPGPSPCPVEIVDGVLGRASGARINWKFTTQRCYVSDLVLRI